jgi:hypothetical protein
MANKTSTNKDSMTPRPFTGNQTFQVPAFANRVPKHKSLKSRSIFLILCMELCRDYGNLVFTHTAPSPQQHFGRCPIQVPVDGGDECPEKSSPAPKRHRYPQFMQLFPVPAGTVVCDLEFNRYIHILDTSQNSWSTSPCRLHQVQRFIVDLPIFQNQ